MRSLSPSMQASFASGCTTFCRCWLLTRTDGVKLGFTDHDRDLTFGGVTYEAQAGMTASAVNATDALNIDTTDIAGALQSERLNEADLAGGLYDGAALTLFLVDWSNPADRDIIAAGSVGEVARGRTAFTAEMRGLSHALNQQTGRLYTLTCGADLGDARCAVDLNSPTYKGSGTVTAANANNAFAASGLDGYAGEWFTRGKVTWATGANAGAVMEVKFHINNGAQVLFELWESMAFDIAAGDTFTVTAGCDKAAATCIAKFNNIVNFRGFPFIPGNDAVFNAPSTGGVNDGGALV